MKKGLFRSLYVAADRGADESLDALLDRLESLLIIEDMLEPGYLDDDADDD